MHIIFLTSSSGALLYNYQRTDEDLQRCDREGGGWDYCSEKDPTERITNEMKEAVMIHTKTIDPWDTARYDPFCKLYWNNSWKEKCN